MVYHYPFHVKPSNLEANHKGIMMGLEGPNLISIQEANNWLLLCLNPLEPFVLFFLFKLQ